MLLFQTASGHVSQQDLESRMRELIYTDSDLVITPIIDNPKVWKDAKTPYHPGAGVWVTFSFPSLVFSPDSCGGLLFFLSCRLPILT